MSANSKRGRPRKNYAKRKVFCRDCSCGSVHFDGKRIDVHFAKKGISDETSLEVATKLREQCLKCLEAAPELKFIPVHACFQENLLQDEGVKHLCSALLHDRLQIDSLKLYKNQVNDSGAMHVADLIETVKYPITEIHLSHNLITIKSARAIFSSIRRQDQALKYPCLPINAPPSCKKPVPLWLRLEHNFIDLLLARQSINELRIRDCSAESHKNRKTAVCGPRMCKWDWENCLDEGDTPLHIFMFQVQYTPSSLVSEPAAAINEAPEEIGPSGPGPLFLFVDTNAALRMATKDDGFSFRVLLNKASRGNFGWRLPESQRVSVVLPFTVLRELDALKCDDRLRAIVAKLHKEIFPEGEDNGTLQLLNDSFEGKMKLESGSKTNDEIILKQIRHYQTKLGASANCSLLTGDRSMITIAKQMRISVIEIEQLESSFDLGTEVWSSDLLWECIKKHSPSLRSPLDTYISTLDCLQECIGVTDELIKAVGDNPKHAELISRSKKLIETCQQLSEEAV